MIRALATGIAALILLGIIFKALVIVSVFVAIAIVLKIFN